MGSIGDEVFPDLLRLTLDRSIADDEAKVTPAGALTRECDGRLPCTCRNRVVPLIESKFALCGKFP